MKQQKSTLITLFAAFSLSVGMPTSISAASQNVMITFEDRVYQPGESVSVTIQNNLDEPILSENSACSTSQPKPPAHVGLGKNSLTGWQEIDLYGFPDESSSVCRISGDQFTGLLDKGNFLTENLALKTRSYASDSVAYAEQDLDKGVYRLTLRYAIKGSDKVKVAVSDPLRVGVDTVEALGPAWLNWVNAALVAIGLGIVWLLIIIYNKTKPKRSILQRIGIRRRRRRKRLKE